VKPEHVQSTGESSKKLSLIGAQENQCNLRSTRLLPGTGLTSSYHTIHTQLTEDLESLAAYSKLSPFTHAYLNIKTMDSKVKGIKLFHQEILPVFVDYNQ